MYIIILLIFKSFILKEINKYIVNSYEKKIQTSTTYTSSGEKKNRDSLIKMFNQYLQICHMTEMAFNETAYQT